MKLLSKALPAPGLDGSIEMRTSQHALCAWLRQCQGRSRRWLREHARMPSRERRAALAMAVVLFGVVICAGHSLSRRGAAHRVGRPPLPPPLLKRPNKVLLPPVP